MLRLAPGDYTLEPETYLDPTCGNCADPHRPVPATLGLRVSGADVTIAGPGADLARLHTRAGYGLLFEDCADCRLSGVTVTGGARDTCGLATDAAIVVRRSRLAIERCRIAGNLGDSATVARTVVGIMGVCGREGAEIRMRDCEVLRNSWDGVALYRDAFAEIRDCVIDGVEYGLGGPARGGRGVAIGVTWNARAEIRGNWIRRYWKGVGLFVDAQAVVSENVIEDVLTWGITLWDAGEGRPYGEITWNAIDRTGACGIAVTRGLSGGRLGSRVTRNALSRTGRNARYDPDSLYCRQCALAIEAATPEMEIARNAFLDNREPGDRPGTMDLEPAAFEETVAPLLERLRRRPALAGSDWLRERATARE